MLLGLLVDWINKKYSFKTSVIIVDMACLCFNLIAIVLAKFGPILQQDNFVFVYLAYFLFLNAYILTWSGAVMGSSLFFNKHVQSQALGICYSASCVMLLSPNAIYLSGISVGNLLLISGGLNLISLCCIYITWKFKKGKMQVGTGSKNPRISVISDSQMAQPRNSRISCGPRNSHINFALASE